MCVLITISYYISFFVSKNKRAHNDRIKLRSRAALKLLYRILYLLLFLIRPIGSDGVKCICNSYYPRDQRYVHPLKPVRITRAIEALLMMTHFFRHIAQFFNRMQDRRADYRVLLYLLELFRRELAMFIQDMVRYSDLSYVVEEG